VQETEGWQAVQGGWMNNASSAGFFTAVQKWGTKICIGTEFLFKQIKII
jgi:hypothetical protein